MWVSFEGLDGCGKTTQQKKLAQRLTALGHLVYASFEPGGWLGEQGEQGLRQVILHRSYAHPLSRLLLFLVDRMEHCRREILPALEQGKWVVLDRYHHSTLAYQLWGEQLDESDLAQAQQLLQTLVFPQPDYVFYLDLPEEVAWERRSHRDSFDQMEAKGREFQRRVAQGFRALAADPKYGMITIDGSLTEDQIFEQVCGHLGLECGHADP